LAVTSFEHYVAALEQRHLADLRFSEVTRALRALSSAYVERRESALADHRALEGAGKRAAFALYYGPLHFLLVQHIAREIGATFEPGLVVDLGCGTGAAGAAIALRVSETGTALRDLRVLGLDTHPWALDEARFTYKTFGLKSDVRRAHAAKTRFPADSSVIVAAFMVNELAGKDRAPLLDELKRARRRVLIVEPISQRISPWWDQWAAEFQKLGGRADLWKARIEPPPIVKKLAKAAGLRPDMLTARSLFL
jgi:SAM-dependent methyltransferase